MSDKESKPIARVQKGALSVSIFPNESQQGRFYNAAPIERAYTDQNNETKYTKSLRQGDLQPARKLLDMADDKMQALRQADKAAKLKQQREQSADRSEGLEM